MRQRSLRKPSPWLHHVASGTQPADACLVCVPPAGGAASAYWTWTQWLPSSVDLLLVQPPGREDRDAEPAEWTLDELREVFTRSSADLPDVPYYVLGHSMGALVGTHIASWLASVRELRRLIVSSYRPDPSESRFSRVFPGGGIERIDLAQLQVLSGVGAEEWRRLPAEIQQSLTRRYYADLGLSAVLPVPTEPLLDCPVTAWLGYRDFMSEGEMTAWSKLTSGTCEVESWPGGHDYIFARPSPVRDRLVELIGPDLHG
ncbi:alpha/beta fold hydrolase [Streptomyces sp. PRh5]|uniref:thioesterase II family protein n=1 Tax=Streptomyces sp. PRh5 TaxID=1158056 RepID=UPI0012FE9BDE|nr:alpha/beta fold hydrolase [Streptomyces sp. PRh5]